MSFEGMTKREMAERIRELEGAQPTCDGGCSYNSGPEETCSLHGRPVAEVWEIVRTLRDEVLEEAAQKIEDWFAGDAAAEIRSLKGATDG